MLDDRKRTETVKIMMTEKVFHDIGRLCARDDRSPAELIHLIVKKYLYGNSACVNDITEGTVSARECARSTE